MKRTSRPCQKMKDAAPKAGLQVGIACLSVALLCSNSIHSVRHMWNLGWIGFLLSLLICCFAPDPSEQAYAAELSGVGLCVAFYVTNHGNHALICNTFGRAVCEHLRLEVLAFATFFIVHSLQLSILRIRTSSDANRSPSRSTSARSIGALDYESSSDGAMEFDRNFEDFDELEQSPLRHSGRCVR